MKHRLTVEQQLSGACKALAKLEAKGPRYRGLVAGIRKNIQNLEAILAMPYKDRETYLRKQREFHARRKASNFGVSSQNTSPPTNLHLGNIPSQRVETRLPVSGKREPSNGVNRPSVPLTPLTPAASTPRPVAPKVRTARPIPVPQSVPTGTPIQPMPNGVRWSQVCWACLGSGYSSPGTRCGYCRRKR
jgi:hypothetical protein